jgi:hypothetical protein
MSNIADVIPKSRLFATPESLLELDEYIRRLPKSDHAQAYLISMMTMNLCHQLVTQECEKELT